MLMVHAQPGARRTECVGLHGGAIKLRIGARAVEHAANDELISFLAEALQVTKKQVEIVSGRNGREKRVRVTGVDRAAAETLLSSWGISAVG